MCQSEGLLRVSTCVLVGRALARRCLVCQPEGILRGLVFLHEVGRLAWMGLLRPCSCVPPSQVARLPATKHLERVAQLLVYEAWRVSCAHCLPWHASRDAPAHVLAR